MYMLNQPRTSATNTNPTFPVDFLIADLAIPLLVWSVIEGAPPITNEGTPLIYKARRRQIAAS